MPRKARDVIAGLQNKGFRRRDAKDIYLHLFVAGRKTAIWTKVSHGEKEIHDGLIATMSRQLRLNKRQFGELVECPLSEEQYLDLLRGQNHLE
jgi:predicted RNA binding protein YcfA (HicA-like mRNA interferase family)